MSNSNEPWELTQQDLEMLLCVSYTEIFDDIEGAGTVSNFAADTDAGNNFRRETIERVVSTSNATAFSLPSPVRVSVLRYASLDEEVKLGIFLNPDEIILPWPSDHATLVASGVNQLGVLDRYNAHLSGRLISAVFDRFYTIIGEAIEEDNTGVLAAFFEITPDAARKVLALALHEIGMTLPDNVTVTVTHSDAGYRIIYDPTRDDQYEWVIEFPIFPFVTPGTQDCRPPCPA